MNKNELFDEAIYLLESVLSIFDELDSVSWDDGSSFQNSSYTETQEEIIELLENIKKLENE